MKSAAVRGDDTSRYVPSALRSSVGLKSVPKLDMDSALALLRRELAAMQQQDKALHSQLLGLQASIVGLKVELSMERELENREVVDMQPTPPRVPAAHESRAIVTPRGQNHAIVTPHQNHAIVTRVEVLDNRERESTKLHIDHAKQDSGILTDDGGNSADESPDDSVRKPSTTNFVRLQNGRSYSSYWRKEGGKANFLRSAANGSASQPSKVFIRSVEVPKSRRENAEVTISNPHPGHRQRSQTMPNSPLYRVSSMPVINEAPFQERDTNDSNKDKSFAVYAYHKTNTERIEGGKNSALSSGRQHAIANHHPPEKAVPAVVHSLLQRHDSVPVLSSNVSRRGKERLRTASDSRVTKTPAENARKTNSDSRPTRRVSASYVDLRRTSSPDHEENTAADGVSRHEPTETRRLTRGMSTSCIDLTRKTSLSPSEEKAIRRKEDFNRPAAKTESLTRRVSTSYIDIRARSAMYEGGKSVRDINCNKPDNHGLVRRVSSSYVDLRSSSATPIEEAKTPMKDINFNELQPMHKLYRSHSHTSLV